MAKILDISCALLDKTQELLKLSEDGSFFMISELQYERVNLVKMLDAETMKYYDDETLLICRDILSQIKKLESKLIKILEDEKVGLKNEYSALLKNQQARFLYDQFS